MAAKLKLKFIGKKGNFFEPLIGIIVLSKNCGTGENGEEFLSNNCASIIELESQVNSLKSQLDEIVKEAKKKFA